MKYLLIIGLIILSFVISLDLLPLFDVDEGAFAQSSREMLLRGDYLTTYLNGELRFDKPILIYWLQAFSMTLFGENEVAVRLPSLLATLLWLILLISFVGRYKSKENIFTVIVLFVSTFIISVMSVAATADMLLNATITGTMLFLYRYYDSTKKDKHTNALYIATIFMALGVLTKGPIAIMIPVVVMGLFLLLRGEFRLLVSTLFNYKAIFLFLAITAPWYVLEYLEQGEKFIEGFILQHNIARFNQVFEQHSGGYYYYILILPLITLPFAASILSSVFRIRSVVSSELYSYLYIWFIFVFIFFSLSGTKLPHYIIYGLTPLLILGALLRTRVTAILDLILVTVFFIFLGLIPEILDTYTHLLVHKDAILMKDLLFSLFDKTDRTIIFISLCMMLVIWFFIKKDQYRMLVIAFTFVTIVNVILLPAIAALEQNAIKHIALFAKNTGLENVKTYKLNKPSFSFYSKIITSKNPVKGDIVFIKEYHLEDFEEYEILIEKNGYYLIKLL